MKDSHQTTVQLVIEQIGSKTLGKCYYATFFKIKSLNRPLSDSDVICFRDMGLLGFGQDFFFTRGENEKVDEFNTFNIINVERRVDSSD